MIDPASVLEWLCVLSARLTVLGLGAALWIRLLGVDRLRERSSAARSSLCIALLLCVLPTTWTSVDAVWRMDWAAPPQPQSVPLADASLAEASAPSSQDLPRNTSVAWGELGFALWAVGVAWSLLRWGAGALCLSRIRLRANPCQDADWSRLLREGCRCYGISRLPDLRLCGWQGAPALTGVFRPMILLPREATSWSTGRRRAVLFHELAHWRRADRAFQWISRLLRTVFWFHPIVRYLTRLHASLAERVCDRDALRQAKMPAGDYATHLIELARAGRAGSDLASIGFSRMPELERRVRELLDREDFAWPARRQMARSVVLIALLGVLSALSVQSGSAALVSSSQLIAQFPQGWSETPLLAEGRSLRRLTLELSGQVWIRPTEGEPAIVLHAVDAASADRWRARAEIDLAREDGVIRAPSSLRERVWIEVRCREPLRLEGFLEVGDVVCESPSVALGLRVGVGRIELSTRSPLFQPARLEVGRGSIRVDVPRLASRLEAICGSGELDIAVRGSGSRGDCLLRCGRGPIRFRLKDPSELHGIEGDSGASGIFARVECAAGRFVTTTFDD